MASVNIPERDMLLRNLRNRKRMLKRKLDSGRKYKLNSANKLKTLEKKKLADYRRNFGSLTKAAANAINTAKNSGSTQRTMYRTLNKNTAKSGQSSELATWKVLQSNRAKAQTAKMNKVMSTAMKDSAAAKKADDLKTIMQRWAYENNTKEPVGGFSTYGMTAEGSKARNRFKDKKYARSVRN
jgi:hypothetical protein